MVKEGPTAITSRSIIKEDIDRWWPSMAVERGGVCEDELGGEVVVNDCCLFLSGCWGVIF